LLGRNMLGSPHGTPLTVAPFSNVGETLAVSLPPPNGDFLSIEDW